MKKFSPRLSKSLGNLLIVTEMGKGRCLQAQLKATFLSLYCTRAACGNNEKEWQKTWGFTWRALLHPQLSMM